MKSLPVLACSVLLLSACMHHDSKPIQFYRLTADVGLSTPPPAPIPEGMIGLGPIHIPDYLNRPQMMVGLTEHQFKLAEHHRWAERLDQNIALALFKALPDQLGSNRMIRYPWPQRQVVDYQISIDIVEFHVDANGQSRLIAQWSIKHNDQTIIDKRSVYQAAASTSDYDTMVTAQSLCLSQLGQEIAATLRKNQ
ncbi:MAG: PqiC family protein [Methylovulum sp.]|nr:PqiC family protein [Methylovulum sp.]